MVNCPHTLRREHGHLTWGLCSSSGSSILETHLLYLHRSADLTLNDIRNIFKSNTGAYASKSQWKALLDFTCQLSHTSCLKKYLCFKNFSLAFVIFDRVVLSERDFLKNCSEILDVELWNNSSYMSKSYTRYGFLILHLSVQIILYGGQRCLKLFLQVNT